MAEHHVYIRSKEHTWLPGRLVETKGDKAVVAIPTDDIDTLLTDAKATRRKNVEVKLKTYPNQTLPLQNVDTNGNLVEILDMANLAYLNEPAILYGLKSRHMKAKPYARAGDIVIACNPYQWLTHLYSDKMQNLYNKLLIHAKNGGDKEGLEPHVYETSGLSYRGLLWDGEDQSILVSGESGAGKTETVKICLNHVAAVASASEENKAIVQRVTDSNPLLEAFGNAKTRRNDNSSRFGKYLQLQFAREACLHSPTCDLAGSKCEVYLLEKSRVVTHEEPERNYHIFYQLLGAPNDVKVSFWSKLRNTNNESFSYIGYTATDKIEGKLDGDHFADTCASLALVGVKDEKLDTLVKALCAVLQLGNLSFSPDPKNSEGSIIDTKQELKDLSSLIGVSEADLTKALTFRTVETRGEVTMVPLKREEAQDSADALAKEIYGKLFLWLVDEINNATKAEKNYKGGTMNDFSVIGLLDIFGFESFDNNGLEQLCINYANEKLQQKFTQDIFQSVQLEYEAEGIPLDEVKYDDNCDVLDLIEGKTGLLAMLNEECKRPKGSDKAFVYKMKQTNGKSPCLVAKPQFDDYTFGINHYAGTVVYNAQDFVVKNNDTLPGDLVAVAKKSSNFIIAMEEKKAPAAEPKKSAPGRKKGGFLSAATAWTKYKEQLSSLLKRLKQTRSRYIRCIKPNTKKKPLLMMHDTTVEQLRCAGVIAAVTISRSAFPNRLPNAIALNRFRVLFPRGKMPPNPKNPEEERNQILALMSELLKGQETEEKGKVYKAFAVGKSRSYFKAGALEYLEGLRQEVVGPMAVQIQRIARGFLQRIEACKVANRMKRAQSEKAKVIQNWWKTRLAVMEYKRMLEEKRKLEKMKLKMRGSATKIQAIARGWISREEYKAHKQLKDLKSLVKEKKVKLAEPDKEFEEELEKVEKKAMTRLQEDLEDEQNTDHKANKVENKKKKATKMRSENKRLTKDEKKAEKKFKKLEDEINNLKKQRQDMEAKIKKLEDEIIDHDVHRDQERYKDKLSRMRVEVKFKRAECESANQQRIRHQKMMIRMMNLIQDNCDDDDLVDEIYLIAQKAHVSS